MRVRLSFSNVISLLALFIALGGASYAAFKLPSNSVGPTQLRNNAVTSGKVRNHSLRAVDFAKGQLPSGKAGATGRTGPQGLQGPKGADGSPGSNGAPGTDGTDGTNGTNGIGLNGFFGSASGPGAAFVVHVDSAIAADVYVSDLTIDPGKTLRTSGYRVFVSGTLTLGDGSHIERDGNAGNQGFGAALLPAGTLGLGGHGGGNTCQGDLTSPTNSLGGVGGGTSSCGGGLVTAPPLAVGGPPVFDNATSAITGRSLDGVVVNGGAGGRGGNFTGGGGGGGVVVVAARTVVVTGSASITANGGRSGGSDSGGGGGGVVVVLSTSPKPAGVTLSAAGGPVGTGGGGDNGGTAGSPGFTEWLN